MEPDEDEKILNILDAEWSEVTIINEDGNEETIRVLKKREY